MRAVFSRDKHSREFTFTRIIEGRKRRWRGRESRRVQFSEFRVSGLKLTGAVFSLPRCSRNNAAAIAEAIEMIISCNRYQQSSADTLRSRLVSVRVNDDHEGLRARHEEDRWLPVGRKSEEDYSSPARITCTSARFLILPLVREERKKRGKEGGGIAGVGETSAALPFAIDRAAMRPFMPVPLPRGFFSRGRIARLKW